MPKKIKKKEEVKYKKNEEKIINVNNVNYFLIGALIILVVVCACVGVYKYNKDKYHVHASNPIVSLTYSEKVEENGYVSYDINSLENGRKYINYDSPSGENFEKRLSDEKYLDLNEELYSLGVADSSNMQVHVENSAPDWSMDVRLEDGSMIYFSSDADGIIDKAKLAQIIKKYFNKDIMYK